VLRRRDLLIEHMKCLSSSHLKAYRSWTQWGSV
jgi:hypothetical protein